MKDNKVYILAGLALGAFLLLKKRNNSDVNNPETDHPEEPALEGIPKRGKGSDFLKRRAFALTELYDSQLRMEYKPVSYGTVERRAFYDPRNDTFRLIGKSYDYTSNGY